MVEKWKLGSSQTLITGTALNGLANNALVLGAAINNIQGGGGGDGFTLWRIVATFKYQVAPTAGTGIAIWFIRNTDGATGSVFEDGSSTVTPSRGADLVIPNFTDTSVHSIARDVLFPPGFVKALWKNDGSGQALTANNTDNTLVGIPYTPEGV